MLGWPVIFGIIAAVAAFFTFGSVAAGATAVARMIFYLFTALFAGSVIAVLLRRK